MRILVSGDHYHVIEHRRLVPNAEVNAEPQTVAYAATLISDKRQAKKRCGLSGRQGRKQRKAMARAIKNGTIVPTTIVDEPPRET